MDLIYKLIFMGFVLLLVAPTVVTVWVGGFIILATDLNLVGFSLLAMGIMNFAIFYKFIIPVITTEAKDFLTDEYNR